MDRGPLEGMLSRAAGTCEDQTWADKPEHDNRDKKDVVPYTVTANLVRVPAPSSSLMAVSSPENGLHLSAQRVRKLASNLQATLLQRVDDYEIRMGWMTNAGHMSVFVPTVLLSL